MPRRIRARSMSASLSRGCGPRSCMRTEMAIEPIALSLDSQASRRRSSTLDLAPAYLALATPKVRRGTANSSHHVQLQRYVSCALRLSILLSRVASSPHSTIAREHGCHASTSKHARNVSHLPPAFPCVRNLWNPSSLLCVFPRVARFVLVTPVLPAHFTSVSTGMYHTRAILRLI